MDSAAYLERTLLYTDRDKMSEFGMPEYIEDGLYKMFLVTKDVVLEPKHTSKDFFNEVFYYITRCYAYHGAAEKMADYLAEDTSLIPYKPEMYMADSGYSQRAIDEYESKVILANRYVYSFVWVILKLQDEFPRHVEFFTYALGEKLDTPDNPFFSRCSNFVKETRYRMHLDFRPTPNFVDLFYDWTDFEYVTNSFSKNTIIEICQRFNKQQDKLYFLTALKKYFLDALKAEKENKASNAYRWLKLQELDQLIEEAETDSTHGESIGETDTTIREGFEAYITKNHKRVIDILMLVANMGKSQMPLLIKFIKAFQRLGYIKPDCFDQYDLFLQNASEQFTNVNFDKANVKRNIEMGTRRQDEDYEEAIQNIANYLTPLL